MTTVLLFSALAICKGDVSLSPESSTSDVSISFGSHATVTDSEWILGTDTNVAPEDWALEVQMSSAYQFSNKRTTVTVTVDGQCIDSQCDMFWGFGDGNKFITFAHDLDGGLWVRNKQQTGMYAFPQCGGALAQGDLTAIMAQSSTSKRGFWELRDDLAQGDRTNFEEISTDHNDHTWPVTIEVTNDMDAHQVTFRFYSDTVDVECVYDDVFAADTDLMAAIAPDVGRDAKDDIEIHSVSVNIDHLEGHGPGGKQPKGKDAAGFSSKRKGGNNDGDITADTSSNTVNRLNGAKRGKDVIDTSGSTNSRGTLNGGGSSAKRDRGNNDGDIGTGTGISSTSGGVIGGANSGRRGRGNNDGDIISSAGKRGRGNNDGSVSATAGKRGRGNNDGDIISTAGKRGRGNNDGSVSATAGKRGRGNNDGDIISSAGKRGRGNNDGSVSDAGVRVLDLKDLAIIALLVVNVAICVGMVIVYMRSRCQDNSYKMVSVGTESEMEEIRC